MAQIRDWQSMKDMSARLLQDHTGLDVTAWNQRIQNQHLQNENELRAWLTEQGVTGYAQSLLVWERFGYPDFLQSSGDELIQRQYADRPHLRPIFEAVLNAALSILGELAARLFRQELSQVQVHVDLGLFHRHAGFEPGHDRQKVDLVVVEKRWA